MASYAACVFIDMQNYNCHPNGACLREASASATQYYLNRLAVTKLSCVRLQKMCRDAGVEMSFGGEGGCMFVENHASQAASDDGEVKSALFPAIPQQQPPLLAAPLMPSQKATRAVRRSLTQDGRDRSRDYKLSGFHCPIGSWDAQVIDELKPVGDEIVIPKTSSSVFLSTNLDYLLRSMGKTHVILCGALTDQCVCHATMDACDLHYSVTLVPECCATYSQERHDAAVSAIKGYCRQKNVEELEQELSSQVGNKQ